LFASTVLRTLRPPCGSLPVGSLRGRFATRACHSVRNRPATRGHRDRESCRRHSGPWRPLHVSLTRSRRRQPRA